MEIKNGPVSFFRLLLGGLQTANKAFGSVVALTIFLVILSALIAGVNIAILYVFGPKMVIFSAIPSYLLACFLSVVFSTAVIQILAAKIEQTGMSFYECFRYSLMPALYFLLSSIILSIPSTAILFGASLTGSNTIVFFVYIALLLAMLPFMFTQHAAALRYEGPISSLRYSWELGTAYYGRILLTLIGLALSFLCLVLAVACIGKAVAPHILAGFMAGKEMLLFTLMQYKLPYVITGLVVISLIYGFILLTFMSVITALFLNLDYCKRATQSREIDVQPMPINQAPVVPVPSEVMVKQSSVSTQTDENVEKHLDQVYSAQEHLAQALEQEEDRMPTLLFDEDMVKQLAASEQELQKQQSKTNNPQQDDGPSSIKMSDKTL